MFMRLDVVLVEWNIGNKIPGFRIKWSFLEQSSDSSLNG